MPEAHALLLIAHGSGQYPEAAAPAIAQAEALRAEGGFRQIEVATLAGDAPVEAALARINAPVVPVVPFFMEAGYFTRIAIPRATGDDRRLRFSAPVGTHPALPAMIARMAADGCAVLGTDPAATAVLVVGHGSASAPGRPLVLHDHVQSLAATGQFARVQAACLEEKPLLPRALAALRDWPVVVIGFFAGHGMHVRDDVPNAIATERSVRSPSGLPVRFHGSVGDDTGMARIIRERAAEALQRE